MAKPTIAMWYLLTALTIPATCLGPACVGDPTPNCPDLHRTFRARVVVGDNDCGVPYGSERVYATFRPDACVLGENPQDACQTTIDCPGDAVFEGTVERVVGSGGLVLRGVTKDLVLGCSLHETLTLEVL